MFTQINSGGIRAVRGYVVSVEADVSNGLPGFSISGQLASEVRESQERVRTALRNSGFRFHKRGIHGHKESGILIDHGQTGKNAGHRSGIAVDIRNLRDREIQMRIISNIFYGEIYG